MTGRDRVMPGNDMDRLNDELDRIASGGRSNTGSEQSGFGPTIDRLFVLGQAAGMNPGDSTSRRHQATPTLRAPRGSGPLVATIRRFPMSVTSTAAIVAIVLAITFSTFQNLGTSPLDPSQSGSSLVAQLESTPPATPVTTVSVALPRALSENDCNVEPRTREELTQILSTVPESTPERLDPQLPLDQGTFDGLQQTLYAYQACLKYGKTFQWTALESPNSLRHRVYQLGQVTPYTPLTLSEIIAGWAEVDATRVQAAEFAGTEPVWTLDPYKEDESGVVVTENYIYLPAANRFSNSSEVNHGQQQTGVIFTPEDGAWRIESFPSVAGG